jgi:predicted nucleic acid-binding protein
VRVLFDTNVVLDVLLDRAPHVDAASRLFTLVDNGRVEGLICATTATTVHYLAAKGLGQRRARELVGQLLDLFAVAPVDRDVLHAALALELPDYEDAVLHEAARRVGAGIVTRDRTGFANATVPVFAPRELLAALAAAAESPSIARRPDGD